MISSWRNMNLKRRRENVGESQTIDKFDSTFSYVFYALGTQYSVAICIEDSFGPRSMMKTAFPRNDVADGSNARVSHNLKDGDVSIHLLAKPVAQFDRQE